MQADAALISGYGSDRGPPMQEQKLGASSACAKVNLVPPAVETLGLTRRFGAVTAVSELSLSVVAGAALGDTRSEAVAFVLDLTERKRAEQALRRSEAYVAEAQRLSHSPAPLLACSS